MSPRAHHHLYDTDHAKAVLTEPDMHACDPATIFNAWRFLKEARGQAARLGRLSKPHHLVRPDFSRPFGPIDMPDPVAPSPRRGPPPVDHVTDDGPLWLAELSPAPAPPPMPPASQRAPIQPARARLVAWFARDRPTRPRVSFAQPEPHIPVARWAWIVWLAALAFGAAFWAAAIWAAVAILTFN